MIRKNDSSSTALSKRARVEDEDDGSSHLTVAIGSTSSGGKPEAGALMRTVKRTSGLEAPIVALSGAHGVRWIVARLNRIMSREADRFMVRSSVLKGEIIVSRFSPDGNMIAAVSADKTICTCRFTRVGMDGWAKG